MTPQELQAIAEVLARHDYHVRPAEEGRALARAIRKQIGITVRTTAAPDGGLILYRPA